VFEDAPSGIRSAQAAGAKVVAVATTYRPEEISTAETMIASLAEVRFHGLEKAARLLLEIGAGGAVEG
jgi:beta-phosphoglucomutase-like phosphatase (HAD superfamily)